MTDLLLPEGARLIHIGPPKTGTSALQGALAQARNQLPAYGVLYPGRQPQHRLAARAIGGVSGPRGVIEARHEHWEKLVHEVAHAGPETRVIVSSEFWAQSNKATASVVVDRLGGRQGHILITLRPLTVLLQSSWQQYVRNGMRVGYLPWLKGMLTEPPFAEPTPTFWRRHRHDELVERWASVVSPERVTVLVLDGVDRNAMTASVEQLLGLPGGLLRLDQSQANRSLTVSEIELIRQVNIEFAQREWPDTMYHEFVRQLGHRLQEHAPVPEEPMMDTPAWALERAAEIGAAAAERISASGVRVVGDASALGSMPEPVENPRVRAASFSKAFAGLAVAETIAVAADLLEREQRPLSRASVSAARSTRRWSRRVVRRARRWRGASTAQRVPSADEPPPEVAELPDLPPSAPLETAETIRLTGAHSAAVGR